MQEILSLCNEHSSVLRAVFLTGSRVFKQESTESDYDLLFVYKQNTAFGEIKLLAMRLSQLTLMVEPYFISTDELNTPLHFSHPLFISAMTTADHGRQIWGDTLSINWKPDRKSMCDCRVWSSYLILKVIEKDIWPEELIRKKYFPFLIWAALSLEDSIPESELASGQKVLKFLPLIWPEGEILLSKLSDKEFDVALKMLVKLISPKIEKYLKLNKVDPIIFNSWLPSMAKMTGHLNEGQLPDFNRDFLMFLEGDQE